ncbi:MAG: hypothetical protein ACTHQM_26075 [Thermoanaerobaculia bacterium]
MRRALAVLVLLLLTTTAFAESPLAGHWTLDRAKSSDVNAAIEKSIAKMNFIARPIARGRLRKTNPVYPNAAFSFTSDAARVTAGANTLTLPLSGASITWNRDGEKIRVSGRLTNESTYVETFDASDGHRTNTFTASGDELRLHVTVTASRLPSPLTYTLVFRR